MGDGLDGRPLVPVGPGLAEAGSDATADEQVGSAGSDAAADEQVGSAGPPEGDGARGVTVADLEALLFVAERPVTRKELAGICGLDLDAVNALLGDLELALAGRGIRLTSAGERIELTTAPESGELIARYLGIDQLRLSAAALETLAIVAYRQPVTRGVIERIRGVDSDHVVRALLHRRLVVEQGRADSPGRPILYATSLEFMERFGLTSLDDLPPLEAQVAARLVEADDGGSDGGDAEQGEAEGAGDEGPAAADSPAG
jgi:segregation and condensation protein B